MSSSGTTVAAAAAAAGAASGESSSPSLSERSEAALMMMEQQQVEEEEEVVALRIALDVQLEKVRSLSFGDELEYSVDEQVSELLLLLSSYSDQVVQRALVRTIGQPGDPEYTGRYPLHLACDTNAPFQVIQLFLQLEPTKQAVLHKDKWDDLPLHTACSRKDYTQVVELLLQYDESKQSVVTKRYDGSLPIHTACRYNAPPKVIQLLLEADILGETLFMDSLYGQIPLHVACRCNLQTDSLQLLLDYDVEKRSVLIQDDAGRLPLHAAFKFCPLSPVLATNSSPTRSITTTGTNQSSMELILQAMVHGRVERIGLHQWKRDISQKMIEPLEMSGKEEGDADTAFLLDATCSALRVLLEMAVLLELAVWKARWQREKEQKAMVLEGHESTKCDSGGLPAAAGTITKATTIHDFNDHQKRECRITSGAEAIVPGVVAFLENDPITSLLAAALS